MSVAAISSTPAYTPAPRRLRRRLRRQPRRRPQRLRRQPLRRPRLRSVVCLDGGYGVSLVRGHDCGLRRRRRRRRKAATARAADGDYKVRNAHTTQTKDSDGDYRPLASSAAAQSSSAVQAKLTTLKAGG